MTYHVGFFKGVVEEYFISNIRIISHQGTTLNSHLKGLVDEFVVLPPNQRWQWHTTWSPGRRWGPRIFVQWFPFAPLDSQTRSAELFASTRILPSIAGSDLERILSWITRGSRCISVYPKLEGMSLSWEKYFLKVTLKYWFDWLWKLDIRYNYTCNIWLVFVEAQLHSSWLVGRTSAQDDSQPDTCTSQRLSAGCCWCSETIWRK